MRTRMLGMLTVLLFTIIAAIVYRFAKGSNNDAALKADSVNTAVMANFGPVKTTDTVLFGSTVGAAWDLGNDPYPALKTLVNRSIPENTLTHMRKRIREVAKYQPSVIIIEGGLTDLYQGKDKFQIMAEVKDLVDSIFIISPKAKIVICGVPQLPRYEDSATFNPKAREVSNILESLVDGWHELQRRNPTIGDGQLFNTSYFDMTDITSSRGVDYRGWAALIDAKLRGKKYRFYVNGVPQDTTNEKNHLFKTK